MSQSSILFFDVGALVYFVGCASIDYYPLGSAVTRNRPRDEFWNLWPKIVPSNVVHFQNRTRNYCFFLICAS